MLDLLGIDNLLAELILGVGLAMLLGNGVAWFKARRGEAPADVENATFRPGRARFFIVVGLLMTIWALASIITN